jgi:hypothetical protein
MELMEHTYLPIIIRQFTSLIEKIKPDFAFYLSGVDILETDKFGKLKVSIPDCKKRDAFVFQQLKQNNIPVVRLPWVAAIRPILKRLWKRIVTRSGWRGIFLDDLSLPVTSLPVTVFAGDRHCG